MHTHSFLILFAQSSAKQKIGRRDAVTSSTRTSRRIPGTFPPLSKPWWRACRDLWTVSETRVRLGTCDLCYMSRSIFTYCLHIVFLSSSTDGKNQLLLALLKCTGRETCCVFLVETRIQPRFTFSWSYWRNWGDRRCIKQHDSVLSSRKSFLSGAFKMMPTSLSSLLMRSSITWKSSPGHLHNLKTASKSINGNSNILEEKSLIWFVWH